MRENVGLLKTPPLPEWLWGEGEKEGVGREDGVDWADVRKREEKRGRGNRI